MSAVVVPVRAGMPDDGPRYRMWSDDDIERARQFARETLEHNRILAEALREATRALHVVNSHVFRAAPLPGFEADTQPDTKRRPVPEIAEWREWRSFVEDFQRLEREWRLHNTGRFPKLWVANQRGVDVATVTRAMTLTHGLQANDWPPSTWDPDHPPILENDF